MSGKDRYDSGYEYAKKNIEVITAGMIKGETFKMVTHSEGAAYGAGIAQYLIENGYTVETIVHLSADEGDEFQTPAPPITYQFGYEGDWVTGSKQIKGVDKFGIAKRCDLGVLTTHGTTKSGAVFDEVSDLKSVFYKQNIGTVYGQFKTWYTQTGTNSNGTIFSNINGIELNKQDGTELECP